MVLRNGQNIISTATGAGSRRVIERQLVFG
jgi:hypothetical protein